VWVYVCERETHSVCLECAVVIELEWKPLSTRVTKDVRDQKETEKSCHHSCHLVKKYKYTLSYETFFLWKYHLIIT
jgi:hypothetical protein